MQLHPLNALGINSSLSSCNFFNSLTCSSLSLPLNSIHKKGISSSKLSSENRSIPPQKWFFVDLLHSFTLDSSKARSKTNLCTKHKVKAFKKS
ncbi:hypothetical protein L1987_58469 [Smallanthus sonchifolius]|uniref:Uncharacterized protein n=1 Tax=Smallanthus sonchifolius TaxID=185202 RepID=A0ACB9DFB2_9ASTR|nr:hypothetical protein L1987_58469 [Smallanthus sonchifolius]